MVSVFNNRQTDKTPSDGGVEICMDTIRKQNIILIGFMGSGKTSVGSQLATRLSCRFCDTDQMIESKTGDTIKHIFTEYGEEYFRDLETQLLQEMKDNREYRVISTGGGLPLREQNARLLKEMGYVFFLKASKQTTVERVTGDTTRPLLAGEELEQKVERMLKLRTPVYEKSAHQTVITDNRTVEEIVTQIMDSYLNLQNTRQL